MKKIEVEYEIAVGDFRKATYYGLFLRHRRPLQLMFIVLIVGILYALAGRMGFGQVNPLVLFLMTAYLIWGLILFAGTERGILKYIHTSDSMIGCKYIVTLESHRIRIQIPERKTDFSQQISNLTCVFELSQMFMLYISTQQVYLLPKRCLTEMQQMELRENFRMRLGERFGSRFDQNGKSFRLFNS